jgi:hypothetical protein
VKVSVVTSRHVLVPVTVAMLAVACGGGGSNGHTVQPGGQPTTHQVSESSRGATVQAHVGDDIVVTLHSTYWQLGAPAGNVLVARGAPVTATGGPSCPPVPGSGCGTIRADYRVAQAGKTEIEASRASCGEAMRCTAAQGSWSVTVEASR